eukprot:scaffold26204_cov96-Skeletonema_marinoi.AAC.2
MQQEFPSTQECIYYTLAGFDSLRSQLFQLDRSTSLLVYGTSCPHICVECAGKWQSANAQQKETRDDRMRTQGEGFCCCGYGNMSHCDTFK